MFTRLDRIKLSRTFLIDRPLVHCEFDELEQYYIQNAIFVALALEMMATSHRFVLDI